MLNKDSERYTQRGRRRTGGAGLTALVVLVAMLAGSSKQGDTITQAAKTNTAQGIPAPGIEETKAIAEQAYIYGFPMIAAYKAMYEFNVNKASPQFKADFNQIWNDDKTATPKGMSDHKSITVFHHVSVFS